MTGLRAVYGRHVQVGDLIGGFRVDGFSCPAYNGGQRWATNVDGSSVRCDDDTVLLVTRPQPEPVAS